MAKPGDVVDVPQIGLRFEFRATAESTGGAYSEVDVVGRPKGFIRGPHVHPGQTETHTVIEGSMRVKLQGRTHVLNAGDSLVIAPGVRHTQLEHGAGTGRIRVRLEPSGDIDEFLTRLGQIHYTLGFPRPTDGLRLIRDFPLLELVDTEYTFVDEWDVRAGIETVFDILADGRSYPGWWKPVYIAVEQAGDYTLQHFKGRLPYHLHTRTRTIESVRPHRIHGETEGDLRGTGIWTLGENADGSTHVRFDWRVHADRPLLKLLTPVLRPALRWNHNWAIRRAIEGLEPYARQEAKHPSHGLEAVDQR
jgi:quercetin dioxygenase-like cupin family protein